MLTRHRGLIIFLLFAVVGHAGLLDLVLGPVKQRGSPASELGFALIFAPIVLVLAGEWVADDAFSRRWQRLGWGVAIVGALWHLGLDAACLLLPWLGVREWRLGLAGAAAGAVVMALVLRHAVRAFRAEDPDDAEPDPAVAPAREGLLGRLGREARLLGGTPIAIGVVSLGFVGMVGYAVVLHPERLDGRLLAAAGFFLLCAGIALWSGLSRRASLLGLPSPLGHLLPRSFRRAVVLPTAEGLAVLTRRGATIYPWDAVQSVGLGELYGNPAVLVQLRADVVVQRRPAPAEPPAQRERWAKKEARGRQVQRALTGADLVITSTLTEEGPGVLLKQLAAVLREPASRTTLPDVASEQARWTRSRSGA
ncbi:MAG: hypothetical protein U1A78_11945 [Polyangia bacterium]